MLLHNIEWMNPCALTRFSGLLLQDTQEEKNRIRLPKIMDFNASYLASKVQPYDFLLEFLYRYR